MGIVPQAAAGTSALSKVSNQPEQPMGMSLHRKAEINVTPMIDVLLVLLIIFMLITPYSRGLNTQTPQPSESHHPPQNLTIWVRNDGTVRVNDEIIGRADLRDRIQSLARTAATDAAFIGGDRDLDFAQIAEAIDAAKGAGIRHIALMTH